jgi:tetratricopeptide (TPR) repeat protein
MQRSSWIALAVALATSAHAQDWQGRARLDGHVTDGDGAPLGGATVSVESLAGTGGPVVTTDGEGAWVVDGIAAGSWVVEVTAPGYRPQQIGVHLPHESAWLAPLDVQLRRPAPRLPVEGPSVPREQEPPTREGGEGAPEAGELRAALEAGRLERAHALLVALGPDVPGDAGTLVEMGTLFLAAGEPADALVVLDRAVERDPAHVDARFRRALALLALDRTEAARADFERLLSLSPEGPWAEKARLALEELPGTAPSATP